jgi:protein gp37
MAEKTKIEWTRNTDGSQGATWNPIRARHRATGKVGWYCTRMSGGCANCYAEGINRRLGTGVDYRAQDRRLVEIFLDDKLLRAPLHRRKPTTYFLSSMTDLFADFVTDDVLDRIFAVMALQRQDTYQVLTKRPDRMHAYLSAPDVEDRINKAMDAVAPQHWCDREIEVWPLPHVWLGTSVEDQQNAEERRSHMAPLAEAGWLTWVSYEPALGPVDWAGWEGIRWLVSGGESGPKARPSHPDWHRAARDFCAAHGIAYLFKQWGEWGPAGDWYENHPVSLPLRAWTGTAWTDDGWFAGEWVVRIGKKRAGRLLDGRTWDEMPAREAAHG